MSRKNANARKQPTPRPLTSVPGDVVGTASEAKVWHALVNNPNTTTTELAALAEVGKSTAGKILAAWDKNGTVTRIPGIADQGARAANRWHITPTATIPATSGNEPAATREATNAAELDSATGEEPQDSAPQDPTGDAHAESGDNPASPDTAPEGTASGPTSTRRLAKGALRGMVEDFLREHPTEQFSPNDIGKALNRSVGAVHNALERLVQHGYAVRTNDSPKRFSFAENQ